MPVYEVAALTRGQTVAEIVEDYPGLTPAQVEAAAEYAQVYPKAGRPLPARSLKRMLSDMAASGAWDVEVMAQAIVRPRWLRSLCDSDMLQI